MSFLAASVRLPDSDGYTENVRASCSAVSRCSTATDRARISSLARGVVVAPRASELILALSVAVEQRLTAEQLARTFSVYPSLSGSLTEAARKLMEFTGDIPY